MSLKQFNDFLAELFLNWGQHSIKPGYRYQFQSPDNENSLKLFDSIVSKADGTIDVKGTKLSIVTCGNSRLLPVLHSEDSNTAPGFTENFISHLRDEVAGQFGEFEDCALLVIHNSMLDTLINSAENVAQPASIWHPEQIKQAMYKLIDDVNGTRKVSECLLEHRFNQIVDDGATMFGFEKLYNALLDGDLKFSELGLLNDPAILTWDGKPEQINKRLDENKRLYEDIERITHHFPNELEEKLAEKDFGSKFVERNFGGEALESWKTELEFSACKQEQEANRKNLLELESEVILQGELIAKNKSETKAGRRERHLILVIEEDQQDFGFELTFIGGKIERKQCSILHNKTDLIEIANPVNSGGKRSRVTVTGAYTGKAMFFTLDLKREKTAERYKFKVLVIRSGDFYIDAFRNNFLIEPPTSSKKTARITLQTEESSFVIGIDGGKEGAKAVLDEIGQVFDNETTSEINFEQIANESDELHFVVKGQDSWLTFNVEGAIATDSLTLPLILDKDRFTRLYQDDYLGSFNRSKNKVLLDNKELSPKGKRLTLLQWEAEIVDGLLLTRRDEQQMPLSLNDIEATYPSLFVAYRALFDYYHEHRTLPSLCSWGPEYRVLAGQVVKQYNDAISAIGDDILLTAEQKQLINIGFATFSGQEYITPFHPMVIAYYLSLAEHVTQDQSHSFKTLPKVTLDRLNARGLLPFIYDPIHGFSFSQLEKENSFWLELVPQQDTSFSYVRKLVKDKVGEFKNAFSALFNAGPKATLIINSVNNKSNHEIFMGLVDFVKANKDKVCQIHVNLYDDKLVYSEFDRFAETASYDELKNLYELDKGAVREQADMIIDLLRTRLTYSKFENGKIDGKQAYSHLSFFRNNSKVEPRDVNVDKQLSGVVCHGLMAGEAAANKQDSYFTAFGLKNVDIEGQPHLQIAQKLGGLIKPARLSSEPTGNSKSMALVVSDNFRTLLERSYVSSIWTTIIDPKVTLDFFENAKDMVLIHYSDNYTNSANYDAITVTRQTELYKKVLEQDEGGITEEFNAFNGEWLLKMITANANERKEKKGIIGAYKFVNCLLSQSDITWVPLSVAEMIRVTGNIGLKMSDSDFSRNVQGYKSGLISDDVLFVGFKDKQMYVLPLEVKTGIKQTHSKGVQQAKELKRYLCEDILGRNDFAGMLYRGLFIRQVLMQIDKYELYNLYSDTYFDGFLADREWWLQGDYSIAELANYPDGFMLSHVENDTFFEADFNEVDDILKIQLPISYLKQLVSTPLRELMTDVRPEQLCHIPERYLLKSGHQPISVDYDQGFDIVTPNIDPDLNLNDSGESGGYNTEESTVVEDELNGNIIEEFDAPKVNEVENSPLLKDLSSAEQYAFIVKRLKFIYEKDVSAQELKGISAEEFRSLGNFTPARVQEFLELKSAIAKQYCSQTFETSAAVVPSEEQNVPSSESTYDDYIENNGHKHAQVTDNAFNLDSLIKDVESEQDFSFVIRRLKFAFNRDLKVRDVLAVGIEGYRRLGSFTPMRIEEFKQFKKFLRANTESTIMTRLADVNIEDVSSTSGKEKPSHNSNLASKTPDESVTSFEDVLSPLVSTASVITPDDELVEDKVAQKTERQEERSVESTIVDPNTANRNAEPIKILIGHDVRDSAEVYWEPTNTAKFMNTNSGIIGTMGTGKTQCTKSVVTQLYRQQARNVDGKPIGILIFDYKSDYVDEKFLTATNGKKFNLHKLPYNPLSLFGDTPMLPVHTARGFSETMGKAFGLGQKQQLKLRKLIGEAYELAGIKKGDQSTWSKPAPTINDIWALFEETEPTEDSLYAALESLYELEIFEDNHEKCTSLYELVDGITVVELAGYPSEIQNLVVALTMDLFYSQMQKQGKPEVQGDFRQVTKLLLVDEADNFMSQNFPSLRKVLKEGREYGVGVILSTQDITHFKTSENDYSSYILSWIVHRVSQIKNQDIKSIFNKDDKSDQENLMKSIRELDKHYSLYVDGDKKVQKIKDKAFWELLG